MGEGVSYERCTPVGWGVWGALGRERGRELSLPPSLSLSVSPPPFPHSLAPTTRRRYGDGRTFDGRIFLSRPRDPCQDKRGSERKRKRETSPPPPHSPRTLRRRRVRLCVFCFSLTHTLGVCLSVSFSLSLARLYRSLFPPLDGTARAQPERGISGPQSCMERVLI